MYVNQELQLPKDEEELRKIQDYLYQVSREKFIKGELVNFKGLKEIAFCEVTIVTAIHKLKLNKGSNTAGVDGETMRGNILELDYNEIINRVKTATEHYTPAEIRRVNIPKAGSKEVRPLGIAVILDRIIQECIKIIIEPILEAQFFDRSYGFRPLRDTHMALERIQFITHRTGYHWAIEGDISKFFDCVNHNILLGALFHMGIRDRRILQMIKATLKAGIMNETCRNELGVPQGGNLSPLLANVYLNRFDHYITREWEEKKLKRKPRYDEKGNKSSRIFDVL